MERVVETHGGPGEAEPALRPFGATGDGDVLGHIRAHGVLLPLPFDGLGWTRRPGAYDDKYRPNVEQELQKLFPDGKRPPYHVLNVAPKGLRHERIQAVTTACVPG